MFQQSAFIAIYQAVDMALADVSRWAGTRALRLLRAPPGMAVAMATGDRREFARHMPCVSSRCARAGLRSNRDGEKGEGQPGAPTTWRFGGTAAHHGD